MKRPRVYISGPMLGHPNLNFPAFHRAAAQWRAAGWDVFNPAESFEGRTDLPYKVFAEHDLVALQASDAIAMLPGWDGPGTRGAVWERLIMEKIFRKPVYAAHTPISVWHDTPPVLLGEEG